jgi:hypothetical protein
MSAALPPHLNEPGPHGAIISARHPVLTDGSAGVAGHVEERRVIERHVLRGPGYRADPGCGHHSRQYAISAAG